jgi:hypothetical protein
MVLACQVSRRREGMPSNLRDWDQNLDLLRPAGKFIQNTWKLNDEHLIAPISIARW